jgi:tetratricopeptide (TPR) repeat protein
MHEAALAVLDRLARLAARHPRGSQILKEAEDKRRIHRDALGERPPLSWRNLVELDRLVTALLGTGRAQSAAEVLEQANPPERSSWEVLDRMATLRLHLGEPARARALWQQGMGEAPDPAVADARIGATHLAEENLDAARQAYGRALAAKPGLFEACYGLALLEADAGDATAATELAKRAVAAAPDDRSREAAALLARYIGRFAAASGPH